MTKKITSLFFVAMSFALVSAPAAMAAEEGGKGDPIALAAIMIAAGLAIGLAALGTGIGQGHAIKGATEGVSRNPGASGKILTTMLIGLAMVESLAIYALVVSLILLFANPFKAML
ncbi:MAG: ATP synthase F0 subunit C [Proteobacteria bacterium]|nr:ATP synthase F0 subunit C [Pseudomonadota bacterium]